MKIKLILLFTLFLVFILFCGCIFNENEKNITYGDKDNLELIIESNKQNYNLSSLEELIVKIKLNNTGNEKVKVEKRFDLGANIKLNLYNEQNQTINIVVESSTHTIKEEILKPDSYKYYEFNILNEILQYKNGTQFQWEIGIYYAEARYTALSDDTIISNRMSFEIK